MFQDKDTNKSCQDIKPKSAVLQNEDLFPLLAMTLCYGVYFFALNLWPYASNAVSREKVWKIFIASWLSVPLLAIILSLATSRLKKKYFKNDSAFYPILLTLDFVFLSVAISGIHLFQLPISLIAVGFPIISVIALLIIYAVRPPAINVQSWHSFYAGMYLSVSLLPGLTFLNFCDIQLLKGKLVPSLLLAFISVFHRVLVKAIFRKKLTYILDGVVLLFAGLIVFDSGFHFNILHANFYLGPVNDLLAGKSMLVDISCQYGVLVIYFLASVFKTGLFPFTYRGLSFVISLLLIIQYSTVYFLLRNVSKSIVFSIISLCLIITTNYFCQHNYATWYPSTGPLRFGLVYLLLGLVMIRNIHPNISKQCSIMEYIIVGIASVWSVETFFYTISAYISILVYESIIESSGIAEFTGRISKRFLCILLSAALAYLVLNIYIYSRAGKWPHWEYYWSYLRLYALGNFGALPITFWSPWAIIVAIYFGSLMTIFYKLLFSNRAEQVLELKIVLGMTVSGIAQFTYFLGRGHPNGLYHISIPAIFVASYWIVQIPNLSLPKKFLSLYTYSCYCAIILLFITGIPHIRQKLNTTGLFTTVQTATQLSRGEDPAIKQAYASLWSKSPGSVRVAEALYLIKKYASDKQRIPLLLAPERTTEVLMLCEKANVFPLSNVSQDKLSQAAITRAENFEYDLKFGNILFIERHSPYFVSIQLKIFSNLLRNFEFRNVETTPNGIVAVELLPLEGK